MRAGALAAALLGAVLAGPARADYSKGQELMLLALNSAALAAEHCPYALDEGRVRAFLARRGLARSDMASGRASALLRDDMAADAQRYESDTAAACAQAWASFGPGSPMSGLLRAR